MTSVRKYLYLIILSAALVLGAAGVSLVADVPRPQRISEEIAWPEFFVANADGSRSERITIYDAGDGNCYVFLPSYAQLDRVTVTAGKGQTFTLDGEALTEGLTCENFRTGTPYTFAADGEKLAKLWFRRSENMAAMYIDTVSGSMDQVLHYTYSYPEEVISTRLYTEEGKLDYLDDYALIKGRGFTSWGLDKKSYTLTLDKSTGLLGMGRSAQWALISNGYDSTHLRNRMAYSFAEGIAPRSGWVPDCAFTELYLNGEYAGLYLLCQKPDTGPDHMNLPAEDYYFELSSWGRSEPESVIVKFGVSKVAHMKFPKECTEDQIAFLQDKVQEFHEALISEDQTTWLEYIDLDSWVRKYLLEEVFRNIDGGRASTYFHYDTSEEKFYVGHCWDYDRTLGGVLRPAWNFPNSLPVKRDWEEDVSWFGALYRKEVFLNAVKEYYGQEFRSLLLAHIRDAVPEFRQQVRGTIESEYLRWPQLYTGEDWDAAVEEILTFLQERIAFLDALWLENETFYEIEVSCEYSNLYVRPGMTAEELPKNTCRPDGIWYLEGTDIPFDVTQPVTGNVRLSAFPASETPPPDEEITEVKPAPSGGYSTQDYITFLSIGALGVLLLLFVAVDIFRRRKDRQKAGRTPAGSGTGGGHGN